MIDDHPIIKHMEQNGFLPSWYHCPDEETERYDEDSAYVERRELQLFGEE